jgi:G:T-mismatch repair DNA endonuclease (very short patch repair protein)
MCLLATWHSRGERLRAELESPLRAGLGRVILCQFSYQGGAFARKLDALILGVVEDDSAEALARGQVDVDDRLLGPLHRLNCAFDEILSTGRKDLEPDIIGNGIGGLDQTSRKVKVGLRRRRKRHLNLLVAQLAQHLEVLPFLLASHWVNQALVAIAKVCGEPSRCFVNGLVGPLSVRKVQRLELLVFLGGILEHRHCGKECGASQHEGSQTVVFAFWLSRQGERDEMRGQDCRDQGLMNRSVWACNVLASMALGLRRDVVSSRTALEQYKDFVKLWEIRGRKT